jgi:CRP-like cAMP-binding protein
MVTPIYPMKFEPRNRLLAQLTSADLLNLQTYLKRAPLVKGRVLLEADEPITRVYFVETGIVSLAAAFRNGSTSEMATVGREGMVEVSALLGGGAALGRCQVQAHGSAWALEASRFQSALRNIPSFRRICQAYAQAFVGQALQTAACNSVHTLKKRCVRWLLMSHDRSDSNTFALKQEFLAEMLGVCRSTLTVTAGALQQAGLIRYSRGVLTVLDRSGLEAASCECYAAIRDHFERLLPHSFERPPPPSQQRPLQRMPARGLRPDTAARAWGALTARRSA